MGTRLVYMDNHATTRVDPRVVEVVTQMMDVDFGNAGSTGHAYGEAAREAVESSRVKIAAAIGASDREIVFTSGATESNNLAIRGVAERSRGKVNHIVSVATEHKAVLDPLARLARREFDVQLLVPADAKSPRAGILDVQQVADAIRAETRLVSVMLANNEIGAIHPLNEIGAICKDRGVLLHCDATQAVGRIPVDVNLLQVDLLSFSAHKLYGPKGVGALFVRRRNPLVRLSPQMDGGGQEKGLRSGTLNVPGIVGFGRALELCLDEMDSEGKRLRNLRNRLHEGLSSDLADVQLNGPVLDQPDWRLAANLNLSFANVDGEALMMKMKRVAVASGSACTSANPEPSHVLRAIGRSHDLTRSSLRFGLGRFNTEDDVDVTIAAVTDAVTQLRLLGNH